MIDPDDKKMFAQLMVGLAETYAKDPSKALMRVYWDALLKYTLQQVGQAVQAHIKDPERGRYWPRPADLIAQIPRVRPEHVYIQDQLPAPVQDEGRVNQYRKQIQDILRRVHTNGQESEPASTDRPRLGYSR